MARRETVKMTGLVAAVLVASVFVGIYLGVFFPWLTVVLFVAWLAFVVKTLVPVVLKALFPEVQFALRVKTYRLRLPIFSLEKTPINQ
jgi:hypothetical protein